MPYTLPGDGEDIATQQQTGLEHVAWIVLARSDDVNQPLTADGNGLRVQLGVALPDGSANIGDVDVLTVPADPFGTTADAASATGSMSAKLRQIAAIGIPITAIVPGTSATNLGKARGDAAGATDTGVAPMAVRKDAIGDLAGADGDYAPPQMDASGRVRTVSALADADGTVVGLPPDLVVTVTPTLDTAAFADGDEMVGSAVEVANAAAGTGRTGRIVRATLLDDRAAPGDVDVHVFTGSVTPAAANAAHAISDAHAAKYIGTLSFSSFVSHGNNNAKTLLPDLPYVCDATSLYLLFQAKAAGTYAVDDLHLTLQMERS
jgi:hypothetical protein